MSPALLLGQIAPAIDAAQRLGTASAQVLLGAIVVTLGVAVWWQQREIGRLGAALLASSEARRTDTERLLTVQVSRESGVVTAMGAIAELPEVVRELPEAVREVVRDELGRASDAGRGGRR